MASLHARSGAVGQLSEAMSRLAGLSVDLQDSLDELETLLKVRRSCRLGLTYCDLLMAHYRRHMVTVVY